MQEGKKEKISGCMFNHPSIATLSNLSVNSSGAMSADCAGCDRMISVFPNTQDGTTESNVVITNKETGEYTTEPCQVFLDYALKSVIGTAHSLARRGRTVSLVEQKRTAS